MFAFCLLRPSWSLFHGILAFFLWIYPFLSCSWPVSHSIFLAYFQVQLNIFTSIEHSLLNHNSFWQVASLGMSSFWVGSNPLSSQWPDHWTSYYGFLAKHWGIGLRKTVWAKVGPGPWPEPWSIYMETPHSFQFPLELVISQFCDAR